MFKREVLQDMVQHCFEQYIINTNMNSLKKGGSNYKDIIHKIVVMVDNWQTNNPCPTRRTTQIYIQKLCELFWWGVSIGETNEMFKEN